MLNNVKNFVISKKEAFKVGYGPTKVKQTVIRSLIGGVAGMAIGLMINVIGAVIAAITEGEQQEWLKEIEKLRKFWLNEENDD